MHTVDVSDASGRTPLHYAAIVGNEETLTTLLLCNPDVNRMSKDGTTPLHEAIIHNQPRKKKKPKRDLSLKFVLEFLGALTILLQHHADVNRLFENTLPPLILAVYLQHRNIVELLIRLGVDPNLVDPNTGRSALHYAAYFNESAMIFHLLLSSTVHSMIDINAKDHQEYSVLDYARQNRHNSLAIVDLLLQLNAYDPDRGEIDPEDLIIDKPNIKIFQSVKELSSLKKNEKNKSK